MAGIDVEEALNAPSVLARTTLPKEQKIEIVRRCQCHAEEEAVAFEEGTLGEETDVLRQVLVSLGTLASPVDVHCAPSKQHGQSQSSVTVPKSDRPGANR